MRRPYEVLRSSMRLWYARMLAHAPMTAAPRTVPCVTVGEGEPDRVLLLGNGPVHGWGVLSHGMSAVGHLAEDLWRRTGRPATVDFVGDERMTMASARTWLGDRVAEDHDVVVLAVGMNDALRLEPLEPWSKALRRLLDHVLADAAPGTRIVLVELPHIRAYAMADGLFGSVAQHHAHRLNAVLRECAALAPRIEVVPAPVERFEPARPLGSSAAYQRWAQQLAERLAPALDEVRVQRPPAPAEADPGFDWAGTAAVLDATRTERGSRALIEVTERARERFGVALAAVNVVDGDRIWFAAQSGGAPMSVPRELGYCATTVAQDAPLVVPDSTRDERFRDNPFLDVVRLPFYSGVPLHSLSGRPIGTFCLLDADAHDPSFATAAELQGFAREAEVLLHGIERGVPLPDPPAAPAPRTGFADGTLESADA